jgi:antitoxin component YwqK of YwqJK toxin-antitoxin module
MFGYTHPMAEDPTPPHPVTPPLQTQRGDWLQHDESGQLRQKASFEHGALHGPLVLYDAHGNTVLEESYLHGSREGVRRILVDGRLHTLAHFNNGLQDGETVLHHPSGIASAKLPYKQGVLHGEAAFYDADGNISRRAAYVHGKLQGDSLTYFPNGKLQSSEPYQSNLLHGEAKYFSPDGSMLKSVVYAEGKPLQPVAAVKPIVSRPSPLRR